MKMLADTQGIKIDEADKKELTERFSTMPPHREVPAALRKLRAAGFRLFTLTDNLLEVQTLSSSRAALSIFSSVASVQRARNTISRRARLTPTSRGSLGLGPPSFVLSPAIHGTRSALSRRAGKQR
jgi:2-haloacid dehalogenase